MAPQPLLFIPFPDLCAPGPFIGSPLSFPPTAPRMPSEMLVSMQAGSAVISLAWASGPVGQGACCARLSEAGRLSWEQPLELGQARLVLRALTPGHNLSLSVLYQAGPLQVATHLVVLPVGKLASVGGGWRRSERQAPIQVRVLSHMLLPGGHCAHPALGLCS